MKRSLLPFLACPATGAALQLEAFESVGEPVPAGEIEDIDAGVLASPAGTVYPIVGGVPRLIEGALHLHPEFVGRWRDRLKSFPAANSADSPSPGFQREILPTLRRFEKEWSGHDLDDRTWGLDQATRVEHFLRYIGLRPEDLAGRWMLDAGAGTGQLACSYATLGGDVVGVDLSPAVARIWPHRRRWAGPDAARVHIVQGNLLQPPFRKGAFDVIHSSGVLHHTPSTRAAFDAVASLVKPGGTLAVWLYKHAADWRLPLLPGVRAPALSMSVATLRRATPRLPPTLLYGVVYAYAALFQAAYWVNEMARGRKHDQTIRERVTSLFDTLAPPFVWRHAPAEVMEWFREDGYVDIADTSLPEDTGRIQHPRTAKGRRVKLRAMGLILSLSATAAAQDLAPVDGSPSEPAGQPPGLWRLGPAYFTPSLRITSLGVDTNVFYTATARRTDFIAHGGPGLEMVVPLHGDLKLRADGTIAYLYFARTESQRRLTGSGFGRLAYEGERLHTGAEYDYDRSFTRLGYEVDRRVDEETQRAQADLRYRLGARFAVGLRATGTRVNVAEDQPFFGADPRTNLNRDTYLGLAALSYDLTPKTSFLVAADYQADRFDITGGRDTDSNRFGGGIAIASTSYFSGRALAGARSVRVLALPGQDRVVPYINVDLTYHFGPRTRLTAHALRDVGFTAFSVAEGDLPTLTTRTYGLRLEKGLWSRLDVRMHGTFNELDTDAPVLIETPDGPQTVRRDDRAFEAGADLGYAFWNRLRIGLSAVWSERRSPIADLGVEGLLLGATVNFIPD